MKRCTLLHKILQELYLTTCRAVLNIKITCGFLRFMRARYCLNQSTWIRKIIRYMMLLYYCPWKQLGLPRAVICIEEGLTILFDVVRGALLALQATCGLRNGPTSTTAWSRTRT